MYRQVAEPRTKTILYWQLGPASIEKETALCAAHAAAEDNKLCCVDRYSLSGDAAARVHFLLDSFELIAYVC